MLKNFLIPQNLKVLVLLLGLYFVSTGIAWVGFRALGDARISVISPVEVTKQRARIDPTAPKTETCPLNGKKYTKQEREIWETRRPLTVMIENHQEARPQSGLTGADIVYEAVAEGGITRFLAVFYCGAASSELTIGPVRSARIYFIDWASEYGDKPLYAHVGGANRPGPADALTAISRYGWLSGGNDLNQFSIGFPTFWRDYERIGHPVATEHTMYATTDKLWQLAQERNLEAKDEDGQSWDKNFIAWKFKDSGTSGSVSAVSFSFWSGYKEYDVRWAWDGENKLWKRENNGIPHTDLNNNEQIKSASVIIQFTRERSLGDPEKHMLYTTTGSGDALVFQNGNVTQGTWKKKDRTGRTQFFDNKGQEVNFIPGPVFVEVLPIGTEVSY